MLDKHGNFYFIEMNTRIQVEHPVTEMVTGIDLIKEQIRIAAGQELPSHPGADPAHGHAIECRINAENPHDFRPCPGRIEGLFLPGGTGVRVDTAIYPGYAISPHYDTMVAKIIVHGDTRLEAIRRMRRCAGGVHRGGRGDQYRTAISDPPPRGICPRTPYHLVCGTTSG